MKHERRKMKPLLFVGLALSFLVAREGSGQWVFGPPMNVGRAGHAATVGKGVLYVIGGTIIGDPNLTATVEAFDPKTNVWIFKAPMPTARTHLAAARGGDGRIYAIGGCLTSDGYVGENIVEALAPFTNVWSSAPPMPTARTGLAAVTGLDGRIYAIGGSNVFGGGHFRTVEVYDPQTSTWSTAAPMPTARQWFGATLGPDGRIYAIGGTNQWRDGVMNVVEAYDPASNTWTTLAPMPTRRDGVGLAAAGGLLYAAGGFSFEVGPYGDVTSTVEAYNIASNTWSPASPLLIPQYGPATVTGSDKRVYAIGGGGWGVSSLLQILTPKSVRGTR